MAATKEQVLRAFSHSRTRLIARQPFFGIIAMNLRPVYAPELAEEGALAGVDAAGRLYLPDAFVEECTKDEQDAIISHEVIHVAFLHLTRRGSRDPLLWNYATDSVINDIITEAGMILPKDRHIYNQEWSRDKDNNLESAEAVYAKLAQNTQTITISMDGEGQFDKHIEGSKEILDDEGNPIQGITPEEIKRIVKVAAETAKKQGSLPGSLESQIDDLVEPKIPWKQLLYKYITTIRGEDTNWKKRNQYLRQAGYFPTYESDEIRDIVVAVDTSGSVSDEQLRQFISEVADVLQSCQIYDMMLLFCDAYVQDAYKISTQDAHSLKHFRISGRGGTSFDPVFDYVSENNLRPPVLIYLTDGYGYLRTLEPSYPVIWIINNNDKEVESYLNWGELIRM